MNWWEIAISFLAGSLLGVFFFGGLWWTVQRLPQAKAPALLALLSLILRAGAILGVFYLILTAFSGREWPRLLAALAGFIVMRLVIVSWLRPRERNAAEESTPSLAKEVEKE
ncbi:MAG: ATP synthase subunit I [Firmicutes bacterium]|nr:ATP synthase subunit I [Bacillota bacterium]